MLRSLDLGRSSEASHVRYLLEIVAGVAGDGVLRWSLAALADRMSLPPRSVQRTIERAERLQLLVVRRGHREGGLRSTNKLSVDWPAIAERRYAAGPPASNGSKEVDDDPISAAPSDQRQPADSPPRGESGQQAADPGRIVAAAVSRPGGAAIDASSPEPGAGPPAGEPPGRPSRHGGQARHHGATVTPRWPYRHATVAQGVPLVPINSITAATRVFTSAATVAAGWAAAAEVLRGAGLAEWRTPLVAARAAGLAAAEVLAIVEFWRSAGGAFGPGALCYRLRNAAAGQAAADGWPAPKRAANPLAPARLSREMLRARRWDDLRSSGKTRQQIEAIVAAEFPEP